jgi:hypothetical protein
MVAHDAPEAQLLPQGYAPPPARLRPEAHQLGSFWFHIASRA